MTNRDRLMLAAFAWLGLIASAAATWVHYQLIVDPGYASFCDINATVSCTQAYLSRYGSIAGVPVAVGGLIFFAAILLLGRTLRVGAAANRLIFPLSTLALAAVMYLAYASFFVLREVCPICLVTYVAVIGLFVVSARAGTGAPAPGLRVLLAELTRPAASLVLLAFIAGSVAAVLLFPRPRQVVEASAAPVAALAPEQRAEFERWWELQERIDVPFPRDGARVLIVKFSDYQCPACKSTHYAYAPILARYTPEEVKFLLKQYPLNPECNPSVRGMVHTAACNAAAAGVMARKTGTLDALTDWFFAHQEEMSPASVRSAASAVGRIGDFDAQLPSALEEVRGDAAAGGALKVEWTPTFFINGRRLPREGLPAQYFQAAIEIELETAKSLADGGHDAGRDRIGGYSARSAAIGSIASARRAGR